jgi:hypothetical protein
VPADEMQELHDTFYWANGPCCAGCDFWRSINSLVGECTNSKIISGVERASMLGFEWTTGNFGSGHALTKRDYVCGKFKDGFDWSTLPVPYRIRIGEYHRTK